MEKLGLKPLEKNATLLSQLEKLSKERPDKPAYVFVDKDLEHRVITRQELWVKVRKCAAILNRLGLKKGDLVCNTLVNSPERLITFFGVLAAGAITSQGQLFLADGSDLLHHLKESRCKYVIYDPNVTNGAGCILEKIKYRDDSTGTTGYKDVPDLKHVIEIKAKGVPEVDRWIHVVDEEKDEFLDESVVNSDIAMVFVTSGTTGFSKLVPHTHTTVLTTLTDLLSIGGCNDNTLPFFNMQSFGWGAGFPAFYPAVGCTRILLDLTDDLPTDMPFGVFLLNIFNQFGPNRVFLLTRDIQLVLKAVEDGHKLAKQFDVILTAGGPITKATMEALGKITTKIGVSYGTTESLYVSGMAFTDKSDYEDMCAGNLLRGELKIVDEEETEVVPGVTGDILVKTDTLFEGYLNNPTKTAAGFTEDGWYRTGDVGYHNQEGLLFALGRKADAINHDGFIHYPGWMERRINKHPSITNCVVIGLPDPIHHEEICLCYKMEDGCQVKVDELREYCKALFLTGQDDKMTPIPKHFVLFDKFITNTNGKIDRRKMRQEVLKRLHHE